MMQTIYEGFTGDFLTYSDRTYRRIVDTVFSHCSEKQVKILELGCGSGAFTRFLTEREYVSIDAVDVSESLLAIASRSIKNVNFIHSLITKEFLKTLQLEKYDIVFSTAFLHHLSMETRNDILSTLRDAMKKNALFVCFEPNAENPAILFQYLYETRLNKKSYDVMEFPLLESEIAGFFQGKESFKYYMDVEYRNAINSPPPPAQYGF